MNAFLQRLSRSIRFFSCLCAVCLLGGCKKELPKGVLEKDRMEAFLYDYHMAYALAQEHHDSLAYYERYYLGLVLRKYGMSEADFDRTLTYYAENAELLGKIYVSVDQRVEGSAASGKRQENIYAAMTVASGDTLNLWQGRKNYILSATAENRMTFSVEADTSVHAGDRIMFAFQPQWIYREGRKEALALLALEYANDSVFSLTQWCYDSNEQNLNVTVGNLPLKRISGFIYQMENWSATPKLLVVNDPVLVRFRNRQNPESKASDLPADSIASSDSLASDSLSVRMRTREQRLRDSLLQMDRKREAHFK